jgi:rubredoxin
MKENVRCRGCSWQGVVTKYNRVCPQCGKSNFQQLGR